SNGRAQSRSFDRTSSSSCPTATFLRPITNPSAPCARAPPIEKSPTASDPSGEPNNTPTSEPSSKPAEDGRSERDCLQIGGVRPQPLLGGADRWRAGISVRSRCRACRYRRRCEPEAEDPPLAATSASAAICSSGGSP